MPTIDLDIPTAEWALPHLDPATYKGARGGRSSGKSHFFAELAVESMVCDPDLRFVCIREVQRSLKFSAKSLVENKIKALGVQHLFNTIATEIRRVGGDGIMIFEGMQDHTADSLKSLEGFRLAWVEEAHRISERSLEMLIPTIRAPGSEIWFSWNPDQTDDPVEKFFENLELDGRTSFALTSNDYRDNPWCPEKSKQDAARMKRLDPDAYDHIWLGGYNVKNAAQVLNGKWRIDEFEPGHEWDGPYFGLDFGFSTDPTAATRFWLFADRLFIEYETGGVQWDNDETARRIKEIPGAEDHVIRADSSRPETINELRKPGRDLDVVAAPKWHGSVKDGIAFLRSFEEIVIHERCTETQDEARLWSHKVDRLTGDVLPKLKEGNDHYWDSIRYGLSPFIKPEKKRKVGVYYPGMAR